MGKLGLVLASVALLVVALLLVRREPGDQGRTGSCATPRAELDAAAPLPATLAFDAPGEQATLPTSRRVDATDAQPRGPLRGRLVEAGSGAALCVERVVLLASPRNAVAETLRTRPDGSFTSQRPFPRGLVRAWVSGPETHSPSVRHEAEFDPLGADEWLVPVPSSPASAASLAVAQGAVVLHGLVLDLAGQPVEGAQVKLFPLAATGQVSCAVSTGAAGEFRLEELARGGHRLLVQGRFASSAPLELVLEEGWNEAGRILLPAAAVAGAVRGRLLAEADGEDPFAVVLLRELSSGKELVATTDWSLFSGENDGVTNFALEAVPAGDFELTVVSIDGRAYAPAVLRV